MKRNKVKVLELLKSIETGVTEPLSYLNAEKYIQHNLMCADGVEGFKRFLDELLNAPEPPKVDVVRIFEDGDYVFAHSAYNLFGKKVGFDIFRFEDDMIVEHWDNLCDAVETPNDSGHTMIDGESEIVDREDGAHNKPLIMRYISDVLIEGKLSELETYCDHEKHIEHHPCGEDGISALRAYIENSGINYSMIHKILGEGDFVLAVCEGMNVDDEQLAIYDLYRLYDDKIVEHWGIWELIPARSLWKNSNGKFF